MAKDRQNPTPQPKPDVVDKIRAAKLRPTYYVVNGVVHFYTRAAPALKL